MKPGTWVLVQTPVKAPGTANSTTLRPCEQVLRPPPPPACSPAFPGTSPRGAGRRSISSLPLRLSRLAADPLAAYRRARARRPTEFMQAGTAAWTQSAARIVVVGAGQAGAALVRQAARARPRGPADAGRRRARPALPAPAADQGLPQGRAGARAAAICGRQLLRDREHRAAHRAARRARSTAPPAVVALADGERPALRPAGADHRRRPAPAARGARRRLSAAST